MRRAATNDRALARPHRRALGVAAGLILLEAAVELARPWPLQLVVDHGLQDRPFPRWATALESFPVWALAAGAGVAVLCLTMLGAAATFGSTFLVGRSAERIGFGLRRDLLARLLDLPPRFHRRHSSNELVNRMVSDVYRVEDAVVAWWEIGAPESLILVGTLVVLVLIDPWIALAAVVVCPVLAVTVAWRVRGVRKAQGRVREREGRLAAHTGDLVRNIPVVQAYGQQRVAARSFDGLNASVLSSSVRANVVEARLEPLADLVLSLGAGAVLVIGAVEVDRGSMTIGTLLVALTYLAGLFQPLRSLTRLSSTLARAAASRQRIDEILTQEPDSGDIGTQVALGLSGDVVLDDVTFAYDGTIVLDGTSLHVPGGAITALCGPTGVGKSTLLSLLLGFERPASGRITVGDLDLREFSAWSVRRLIAYLPQESWFLDDTIEANIRMGRSDADPGAVSRAARVALVSEFTARLPRGLESRVGESGLHLSGGQRRRVALARAVLRDADLMLLDEPTAGLDDRAAALVLKAISASARGRTVLVVTHDQRVKQWADHVIDLSPEAQGSPPRQLASTVHERR
ncbi:MAG: ATP-binding cassette, subfamily [Marmoricola sp.]|nr:ATP-binding cassette, subfamily [Marmoricola sp.]